MGFNQLGNLKLEGHQTVTVPFKWGNNEDRGAQYFAANPIGTFAINGVGGNSGSVAMLDQRKAKVFGPPDLTWYYVTVANLEQWGVECDFQGGGF